MKLKLPKARASHPKLHARKISATGHSIYGKTTRPSSGPSGGLGGSDSGTDSAAAFSTPKPPNAAAFLPPED